MSLESKNKNQEYCKQFNHETYQNPDKNIIIESKIKFFRIVIAILVTIWLCDKSSRNQIKTYLLTNPSAAYIIIGIIIVVLLPLWASALKLFPRSINKIIFIDKKIILKNQYGKEINIITMRSVIFENDVIKISGQNKKNKDIILYIDNKNYLVSNLKELFETLERKIK